MSDMGIAIWNMVTRIWVALVLESLAAGTSEEEMLDACPSLEYDDIKAAMAHVAN